MLYLGPNYPRKVDHIAIHNFITLYLCPITVIFSGSPPKLLIFSLTHFKDITLSLKLAFPGTFKFESSRARNPNAPNRKLTVTRTTSSINKYSGP